MNGRINEGMDEKTMRRNMLRISFENNLQKMAIIGGSFRFLGDSLALALANNLVWYHWYQAEHSAKHDKLRNDIICFTTENNISKDMIYKIIDRLISHALYTVPKDTIYKAIIRCLKVDHFVAEKNISKDTICKALIRCLDIDRFMTEKNISENELSEILQGLLLILTVLIDEENKQIISNIAKKNF